MKKLFFSLLATSLFLLIFVGCGKDSEPIVTPTVQKPDLTYMVTEDSSGVIKIIKLDWNAIRATSCTLNGDTVALSGTKTTDIPENTNFAFVVAGEGGSIERVVEVKALLPIITLTADPDSLPFGGGTTTISWTTQHADSVKYNGVWYAPNGSVEIALETTSSFTFTVRGKAGEINSMLTVKVTSLEEMLSAYLCNFGSFARIQVVEYDYNLQGPSIVLFDYYNTLPCAQDDRGYFTMNPNIMVNDVGEYCPGGVGNTHIFTSSWWLNGYVLNDCRTIISLNENELVWTYPSNRGNIPTVIKETYKHID